MSSKKVIMLSLATLLSFSVIGCQQKKDETKETKTQPKKMQTVKQEVVKQAPKQQTVQTVVKEQIKPKKEEKTTKNQPNPSKGQKIFARKLKKECGVNGGVIAKKHTQSEWQELIKNKKLADEISSMCNGAKVNEKYLPDIGAFFIQFASDSGNVPSC